MTEDISGNKLSSIQNSQVQLPGPNQTQQSGITSTLWTATANVATTLWSMMPNIRGTSTEKVDPSLKDKEIQPITSEKTVGSYSPKGETIFSYETDDSESTNGDRDPSPARIVQPDLPIVGEESNISKVIDDTQEIDESEFSDDQQEIPTSPPQESYYKKAQNVFNATINAATNEIRVHGININPLPYAIDTAKGVYRYVAGTHVPTTKSLLEDFADILGQLDNRIKTNPSNNIQVPQEVEVSTSNTSPTPDEENVKLLRELEAKVDRMQEKFVTNLNYFASYSVFDKIIGNTPENPFVAYNPHINAGDPNQAYYATLSFWPRLFAKILLPIIQWILSFILNTKASSTSGIQAIKARIASYVQDPEKMRQEIATFIQTTHDYVGKLQQINEDYARLKNSPQTGDAPVPTLQEYVKQRLEADLDASVGSRASLYSDFNNWLLELINVKTGIPIVGCIFDSIINAILRPVLEKIDFAKIGMESSGLATTGPSSTFVYQMKNLLANKVAEFSETLKSLSEEESSDSNSGKLVLTSAEKDLLKKVYLRLLNYLPLEQATEETIETLIAEMHDPAAKNKTYWDKGIALAVNIDEEIAKTLEEPVQELFRLFYHEFSSKENRLHMFENILDSAGSLFAVDNHPYTAAEMAAIDERMETELNKFNDTLMDHLFRDDPIKIVRDRAQEKVVQFIQTTKETIASSNEKLDQMFVSLKADIVNGDVSSISESLNAMMSEMKQLFANSYLLLGKVDTLSDLDKATKEKFLWAAQDLGVQISNLIQRYDSCSEHLRALRTLEIIDETSQSLISGSKSTPSDSDESQQVIGTITSAAMTSSFNTLRDLISSLDERSQSHLDPLLSYMRTLKAEMDTVNTQLAQHNEIHNILHKMKNALAKVKSLHIQNEEHKSRTLQTALTQSRIEFATLKTSLEQAWASASLPQEDLHQVMDGVTANISNAELASIADQVNSQIATYMQGLEKAVGECRVQKTELQQSLSSQFALIKSVRSDMSEEHLIEIKDLVSGFDQHLKALSRDEQNIVTPQISNIDYGSKKLAGVKKYVVEEHTKKKQALIAKVLTNPRHLEQLLLRGPFFRIHQARCS